MMNIKEAIPAYLAYCREQKRLDAKTEKAYRIDLGQMAGVVPVLDVEDVTSEILESLFAVWHGAYAPKTVKRKIASVKAFFRWLEERGHIDANPFTRIHTRFREPKTLPKTIPEHNLELFLATLHSALAEGGTEQETARALRDAAVMELLFATGIRISELCGLKAEDLNLVEGEVIIHGKGRKERIVQIPDEDVLELLRRYEDGYAGQIRETGYVFINDRGGPLSDQAVRKRIQKYAEKAGIAQHITPHMFRHTFATLLLESDVNIRCIQEILGHSSIQTTEIYTHVSAAKQRQVLKDHSPRKRLNLDQG